MNGTSTLMKENPGPHAAMDSYQIDAPPPDVTFVVIGYNEGMTLRASLESVSAASLGGRSGELLYVDAGSNDDSMAIARSVDGAEVLGGERRRRAAECRNLGLEAARGAFVQFVDGDMALASDWPERALELLEEREDVAAVCGNLNEASDSLLFQALQIDWAPREGEIRHCGGAAMYRRAVLEQAGGFPEDVCYGEEPYLCWRIRNELRMKIYQLNIRMADHDLGFRGAADYWRRGVRCGATYAEIASRCRNTGDPLWCREFLANLLWAGAFAAFLCVLAFGPNPLRAAAALLACAILVRKTVQTLKRGYSFPVAAIYALHTYFCKVPIALGELKWLLRGARGNRAERAS